MIDLLNLTEEDKQHIAEAIMEGCSEGDLGDSTGKWRGWWKLTFEKWDETE
jgi:hypothetical protein